MSADRVESAGAAARYGGAPEALEQDLRAGLPEAFSAAVELLTGDHAWTRARTAEMLAHAPAEPLGTLVRDALASPSHHPMWWTVLAHRVARTDPDDPLHARALSALPEGLTAALPSEASLLPMLHILDAADDALRADLLPRFWDAEDPETVLEAAARAIDWNLPVPESVRLRLRTLPGPRAEEAWIILADLGEVDALDALVQIALRRGPWTFAALDVLEERGSQAQAEALRPLWSRSFFASYHVPRAAACAARLGHADADAALRRLARSRRAQVRLVALRELARIADPDTLRTLTPQLHALDPDDLRPVLDTLAHRPEPELLALATDLAARYPGAGLSEHLAPADAPPDRP